MSETRSRNRFDRRKAILPKTLFSTTPQMPRIAVTSDIEIALENVQNHSQAATADSVRSQRLTPPAINMGLWSLRSYVTTIDWIVLGMGIICAIGAGAGLPLMTLIFGNAARNLRDFVSLGIVQNQEFRNEMNKIIVYYIYLGVGEFVVTYISMLGFIYVGQNISSRLRVHYLRSCLAQDVAYYDGAGSGEMTTRITVDQDLIQESISENAALMLTSISTFVVAFVLAFVKSWRLSLILTPTVLVLTAVMAAGYSFAVRHTRISLQSSAEGGAVVEEVISSIRSITAFGAQEEAMRRYDARLAKSQRAGYVGKSIMATMIGAMSLILYLNYGLAYWVGTKYLLEGLLDISTILTVMMSVMLGASSLGSIGPNIQKWMSGASAASRILAMIDGDARQKALMAGGRKLKNVAGALELRNIRHVYPSRQNTTVLNDLSIKIPPGKHIALVGESGSGKSTIVELLARFYDPAAGQIYLDGHDVRSLDLRWYRQNLSLVAQQPVLFSTSISENIRHGLIGTPFENETAAKQQRRIIRASKMAHAHDFIMQLPSSYDTQVGPSGVLLSGGQKQRIAIARAIIREPKLLVLDEATSALDVASEGLVQDALDAAVSGRTTITITHRLSTIKKADNIIVLANGSVAEQGTHKQLMERKGVYYGLVEAQTIDSNTAMLTRENEAMREKEEIAAPGSARVSEDAWSSGQGNATNESSSGDASPTDPTRVLELSRPEPSTRSLIAVVALYYRSDLSLLVTGLLFCVVCGAANPLQAFFSAKSTSSLSLPLSQSAKIRQDMNFWSLMYVVLAVSQFVAFCIQGIAFAFCSERLLRRTRLDAFAAILRQDIAFFDEPQNSAGSLLSFLSATVASVEGLSGVTLGTVITVFTTLVASFALATSVAWKLALVCASTLPVLVGCGYTRYAMLVRLQQNSKAILQNSASYASEAVAALRTVMALTREEEVVQSYQDTLVALFKQNLPVVQKSSLLYAGSQAMIFACLGLGTWYGSICLERQEYGIFQFYVCLTGIIFGAQSAGTFFTLVPNIGKAKHSALKLDRLLQSKPEIDPSSSSGLKPDWIYGNVEFRNVSFCYPSRPIQKILHNFNLTITAGQRVALVGPSGHGKSTIISLLERFYAPVQGAIYIDGIDIASVNVARYRSFIALVGQEPTLYQGTIKENILLGAIQEATSESDLIAVCKAANIYEFIMSLPQGFETPVGNMGAMLSGGQKQRIAIARALVRNPRILLLDEATSALDPESEIAVQEALDNAARSRTTITVAHRLNTIVNADVIFFVEDGTVVEQGSHAELMRRGSRYAKLVDLQKRRAL